MRLKITNSKSWWWIAYLTNICSSIQRFTVESHCRGYGSVEIASVKYAAGSGHESTQVDLQYLVKKDIKHLII